mgnify:CR=1 FL=1
MMAACGTGDFKTTDSGLMYKFEKQNKDARQVQDGDVLVGEMTIKFDTTETFSNVGHVDRIMQATKTFDGDLYEGLLMMHVGDKATFAIAADTLAKFLQPNQMPPYYKPGTDMKIYYEISLQDIVTKDELLQEQANFMQEMQQRQKSEPEAIANYISSNNIKEKANSEGLYVIVKKKGNGPKVAPGKKVAVNYTGSLLDGTIFDSSVESDARRGNIYEEGRTYEPLSYTVGQMSLIKGWEDGIMGQAEGSILQLVMPSNLGYGSRSVGERIPPYSPLVFDIEIVSVR